MTPLQTEGVLRHQPARRKNHEVAIRRAGGVSGRSEHGIYRGVRMIEAHGSQGVEAPQIVAAGCEVAVPGDDVQRTVIERRAPELAREFLNQLGGNIAVLETR